MSLFWPQNEVLNFVFRTGEYFIPFELNYCAIFNKLQKRLYKDMCLDENWEYKPKSAFSKT
ncbi:hypothetical protein R6Q57_018122 [Mikania cordata]